MELTLYPTNNINQRLGEIMNHVKKSPEKIAEIDRRIDETINGMRYGDTMTLLEISEIMEITTRGVFNVEKRALLKLRRIRAMEQHHAELYDIPGPEDVRNRPSAVTRWECWLGPSGAFA